MGKDFCKLAKNSDINSCTFVLQTGEMEVKNPLFSEETPVTPTPGDERPPEHK